MEQNNQPKPSNLKSTLLQKIEDKKLCPRSRWFFRSRECLVWFLWFVSVVIGALAVAISVFVVTHHQYALYEATHDNFFTFLVEVLPYIWIIVFAVMVGVAVFNIRHTRRGYRYSLLTIIGSSVVLSFAGGSTLQYFGFGHTVDSLLGQQMPMYMSQEKYEHNLWLQPEEGRLVGRQVEATLASTSVIVFEDASGDRWRMEIQELFAYDQQLLESGKMVRVLGETKSADARIFHACGVFPWMMDGVVSRKDMSTERAAFMQRIHDHRLGAESRVQALEAETFAGAGAKNTPNMRVCAEIAAVRRVTASTE